MELRFRIPNIAIEIPDSLSCIPDSKAQDFTFHKQKFIRFRNQDSGTWGDTKALFFIQNTRFYTLIDRVPVPRQILQILQTAVIFNR